MNLPPVVARLEQQTPENPAPICVLVVGMAGSGKTTLMAQLQQSTMVEQEEEQEEKPAPDDAEAKPAPASTQDTSKMPAYCINLDPACLDVPYTPSIDIRDTVDYKVRTQGKTNSIPVLTRDDHSSLTNNTNVHIYYVPSKSCPNTIWVPMAPL
jgi:GTPase SAR1 family protein